MNNNRNSQKQHDKTKPRRQGHSNITVTLIDFFHIGDLIHPEFVLKR